MSITGRQYLIFERVNIAIDKVALAEPFTIPSADGFSVKTHPDVISPIDLALVNSGAEEHL